MRVKSARLRILALVEYAFSLSHFPFIISRFVQAVEEAPIVRWNLRDLILRQVPTEVKKTNKKNQNKTQKH